MVISKALEADHLDVTIGDLVAPLAWLAADLQPISTLPWTERQGSRPKF